MAECDLEASSMEGRFSSIVILHPRLYSIKGSFLFQVVIHQSSKVIFHQRSSLTEGPLPPNVVFHQRLCSTKSCPPSKVAFHQRLSSINCLLTSKVVFHPVKSMCKIADLQFISFWQILVRVLEFVLLVLVLLTGGNKVKSLHLTGSSTIVWEM